MNRGSILIEVGWGFRYSPNGTGLSFRKSKVWPSMEPRGSASLTHDAPRGDPRVVHGMACIRGRIGVCLTVSLPFCLTVSGGVSSSLSSPVGGSTIEITQFPVFFANSVNPDLPGDPSPGSHRITYSIIGSRRSASPSRSSPLAASWRGNGRPQARSRAELYSPSIVIMHGRGWSTAYVSPYHHWDLLAGPQRRSVCRSCDS